MRERIRILIADDHAVVRKGLVMVLRLESDFEVIGEAENGRQAVEMARALQPDLIILDLKMPHMGDMTVQMLRTLVPHARIMILTGAELTEEALDILAAGVDGYVLKDVAPDELAHAIRAVAQGEAYLHPAVARRLLNRMSTEPQTPPTHVSLTPRELEILRWMATPATYREIAEKLYISESTVRSHAKRILSKLGQPNRAQAVLAAVRAGLIELPE